HGRRSANPCAAVSASPALRRRSSSPRPASPAPPRRAARRDRQCPCRPAPIVPRGRSAGGPHAAGGPAAGLGHVVRSSSSSRLPAVPCGRQTSHFAPGVNWAHLWARLLQVTICSGLRGLHGTKKFPFLLPFAIT